METETKRPLAEENLGLVHLCANRFRGRGVKFSTYAVPVILGEIKRLFRDGGAIRVSRGLKELSMRLQRLCEEFRQREMREPTITELAQLSGEKESDVSEALCVSQPLISLTAGDDDEGQTDIPTESPDESITDLLALRQIMAQLEPNDRALLELRYFKGLTQSKTAKALGMTQVQVSRREKKLLTRMREELLS